MTTIYLVRHGENDFTGKRLVGRTPGVHLNEKGIEQAEAVAKALSTKNIKLIYTSPLERAYETALPLSKALNLPVQPNKGLEEVDFGDWQGYTVQKMRKLELFKLAQISPSRMQFPNGESYASAQERVVDALLKIASAAGEKTAIACFSHCDVIRLAVAWVIGMPLDAFHSLTAETGSISVVLLNQRRNMLLKLNGLPGDFQA